MATGERPVVIAEGKHLRFMKQEGWEYVARKGVGGVVGLVAVTAEGKLLLVEQFRKPVDARVIEIPAGLAGDGKYRNETLESAARRNCGRKPAMKQLRWNTSAAEPPRQG